MSFIVPFYNRYYAFFIRGIKPKQILKNEEIESSKFLNQTNMKYPYPTPKFMVILIQVHSRLNYLKELINSLRETRNINETLVIFSHDIFDQDINKLIESIDFCAVCTLQIFYPFSIQVYPDKFPGHDPNDCPKSIKKEEAKLRKCNNADNPDTFGHYREATIVQIKHHWFWKLNFVFDKIMITKNLKNLHVLLLEEDHYVFQDSIHIIRKLTKEILSDVDLVSLGYFKGKSQLFDPKSLKSWSKAYWWASSNGIGFVIPRMLFEKIKGCSKMFCEYDDYNWDWSLQFVVQKCFKDHLISLYPTFSRVAHLGEWFVNFNWKMALILRVKHAIQTLS
ncbi:alpha-1-6-mannosyl-glyco 2-beta-N-acetylglucosaminyltransferase isoform X3 [Brachionus plicatilis]|uniref:Alpha-1,6-mannosyl-glycoprotein 2-beta-N-acetylglucosaminyltransferase n=1 Tax=Brachionus plicatilis TaxID=10195 RepID=A0A3M7PG66_BRAPC|nr:alpha-1-6-mannosyl-glyco 2-beta-N-acetylglucosaminyltransferase isoform X3 [Brachionus plicatilis]